MFYSFNNPVSYYLVKINQQGSLANDFKRIIDYLLTFVGDLEISKTTEDEVIISYTETPLKAVLKTHTPLSQKEGISSYQINLTCERDDNISINLLKNITKNIGYRIFNPQTGAYLVNDPNVLDLTTVPVELKVLKIFKKYKLTPLLQYRDTLVFFARDQDGKIRLVNRHLLEFLLIGSRQDLLPNFSIVVAEDINRFIALFDRGLISLSFYKYRYPSGDKRIINLSGFNLDRLPQSTIFNFIFFVFNHTNQAFDQIEVSPLPQTLLIKKGESLIKKLNLLLTKSGQKNYLAIKVAQDIDFVKQGGNLIPALRTSVFFDK
jgi:hypothetical protein